MLGPRLSWLRTALLTLAGLLLASGGAWAHGGGGHGGGFGHGGGVGHHGVGIYGPGFSHGLGYGIGMGSFGVGLGGIHHSGVYGPGFSHGLGYSPYFGRGYQSLYGFGLGRGYGPGLGFGFGLGYGLRYSQSGYGLSGLRYPYSYYGYGLNSGLGLPNLGYNYGSTANYGYSSLYGAMPADYGTSASNSNVPPPPKDNLAHLLVIVPENAELWFNGTKTAQTGLEREFVSPELTPGKKYSYEIKARWTENGKAVEHVRTARVEANNWQAIDFTKPESSAKAGK